MFLFIFPVRSSIDRSINICVYMGEVDIRGFSHHQGSSTRRVTLLHHTVPYHTILSRTKPYHTIPHYDTITGYISLRSTKLPIAQPLHFLLPHFSLFHPILFVTFIFSWHKSHLAHLVLKSTILPPFSLIISHLGPRVWATCVNQGWNFLEM